MRGKMQHYLMGGRDYHLSINGTQSLSTALAEIEERLKIEPYSPLAIQFLSLLHDSFTNASPSERHIHFRLETNPEANPQARV